MAEALVSTLLQSLTTIALEGVFDDVRLLKGVKGQVRKLKTNLEAIQALLEDAEEKQITDKAIELWLDRLKQASLDMEDSLDEWRTRVLLQRQSNVAENASFLRRKVCLFLECFSLDRGFVRQHHIASSIREINERLDEITKERDRYQLIASNQINKRPKRKESTSFIDESRVVGRDGVKRKIITDLLWETSEDEKERSPIQTVSIVGMGGLGKTALAQLICNDPDIKQHFASTIWACVSEVFDEIQVAKAIIVGLEGLGKESSIQLQSVPLDALLKRVSECIHGKKFLLVLDDVWTEKENDFEALKLTFRHGAPGSRILVTTRKEDVAKVMESQHTIHLQTLNQELCWSILMKKALEGKSSKDLEEVGWEIAAKCQGLPLIAQTLGGLLQYKTTKQEWENVLNSEMWRLNLVERDVFVPLLLSYYDLPSPIRQCFKYCSIFNKDDKIYTCYLIAHWIAQGYLGIEDDSSQLELKGQEYCKILLARSFFQDFTIEGGYPYFKMHDLVHDFALFMSKNEFLTARVGATSKNLKIPQPGEKTRHLTLISADDDEVHFPSSISNAENLRSIKVHDKRVFSTSQALRNLFMQSPRLRLLEMQWLEIQDATTLPEEVGNLLHLRYLNLAYCFPLKELPKQVCKLMNLQFLILHVTRIERLPDEIGNLSNLRLLCTSACRNLTCYPKGVSKLTRLIQVVGLIVKADCDHPQEFSLGDLAELRRLMILGMRLVGKTIDMNEAKKLSLENLQELKVRVDKDMEEDESVFESLNMSRVPLRGFGDFLSRHGFSEPRNACGFFGF